MVENSKKIERISYMKERIQREVFRVFQNGKDNIDISRRMNALLLRDIPQILEEYNVRGKEKSVQDILHDTLGDVYHLDKRINEKSLMFSDSLSDTFNSRAEYVVNSQNEEEIDHELADLRIRLNFEYSERIQNIDKDTIRKENDFFTHEPDFKREVRSYLTSQGISNEEMLSYIERRIKSVIGNIYDEYHGLDKDISSRIEDICYQEMEEFKKDVTLKEAENKEQQTEVDSFRDSLKNEVNSEEEITRVESSETTSNIQVKNKNIDENFLPGILLK